MKEWVIELRGDVVNKLRSSFQLGPILNDQDIHLIVEHTVGEFDGLKIEVFSDEHPPPHFRVKLGSESNCFRIADGSPLYGEGLKRYFRNIRKWHGENKQVLIDFWNKTRPSGCPVGEYKEV